MTGPTFVDVFSGAGGSTLGFVKAGYELVGALDNYVYAAETFKRNFNHEPIVADASRFDFAKWSREVGDVDVVVGCPPCQGFSRMRNAHIDGEGATDPRNSLVYAYIRALKALRPLVAVFENVDWMLRAYGGRYFRDMLNWLKRLGYRAVWHVVNAADYGVPQRRKRLIVVASRRGEISFPKPTHGDPRSQEVREGLKRPWKTVREAISDLPPLGSGEKHPSIPNHETKALPSHWLRLIKAIPKDGGSRKDAPLELWLPCHLRHSGHSDVFGRLWWDKPSVTITTGCWNPSKGRFVHPEQDRGLSLRECARLQSFPDDFVFFGPPGSIAKQIGNALPPMLAKAVAEEIKKSFF